MKVLPILFNTEMVRAILDGRKTVTRRVVKPQMPDHCPSCLHINSDFIYDKAAQNVYCASCGEPLDNGGFPYKPAYQLGDILYVRETWFYESHMQDKTQGRPDLPSGRYSHRYVYKADESDYPVGIGVGASGWRPSIHMPKEAARIWLKVTDVRVERLKDITEEQAMKEGFSGIRCRCGGTAYACTDCYNSGWIEPPFVGFMYTWNSTIKKADLDRYDWDANPFVWAIEFERCERPDENGPAGSPEWKDNFMQRFCKVN